ncbi:MAG: hypothetical protein WCT04_10185 [Planctomycetota bacterium]
MKAIIEQLRTLNDIDVKMGTVKRDLERLPRELAEKRAPMKSIKAAIDKIKMDVIRLKVDADSADLEVKVGEEALKKLGEQMNLLKTQKEFEAIRRQMETQRTFNKENETKELGMLEKIEAKTKDVEKQEAALEALNTATADEAAHVEKEVAELTARLAELTAQREQLAPHIPDSELTIYTRIAGRGDIALAVVKNGNCSMCFMRLPAQIQNLAIIGKDLTCCPSCGRILTAEKKA